MLIPSEDVKMSKISHVWSYVILMFDIQVKPVPFLQPLSSLISVDLMIQEVPK